MAGEVVADAGIVLGSKLEKGENEHLSYHGGGGKGSLPGQDMFVAGLVYPSC